MASQGTSTATLLRSGPMRRAFALALIFVVANVATLGLAYVSLRTDREEAMRDGLDQYAAAFAAVASREDLRDLVEFEAAAADPAERAIALIGPDGSTTGNVAAHLEGNAVTIERRPNGRAVSEAGYFAQVQHLPLGTVVVAESFAPIQRLTETFLALITVNVLPTSLVALVAAYVINARSSRRYLNIERTLRSLAEGDLSARTRTRYGDDGIAWIERELDRMARAQEASVLMLRQVTSNIAHELHTPLQRINVHLAELEDTAGATGPQRQLIDQARAESHRAEEIFQALLQIAQLESGQSRLCIETVDLTGLASTLVDLYQGAAEDAGVRLRLEAPETAVRIKADQRLVGQAISNLVENALKHGGQNGAISVAVSQTGDKAVLTVADNGPGIPEAERDRVVERMYRMETSRSRPGHGLGLSLVKAIADAHGAGLSLSDNKPGLRIALVFDRMARTGPSSAPGPIGNRHP